MSRIRLAFAVCTLAATVSACQDNGSVTGPDGVGSAGGARYNLGWLGTGHSTEPADSAAGGIGGAGSGHYVAAGGIGMAGSGHYVSGDGIGGSGGASATSDTIVTLYGIGAGGSGH